MRSILSKNGQRLFYAPGNTRRVNRSLIASTALFRPIPVGGLEFRLVHAHIGKGLHEAGFCTGMHSHVDLQIEYILFGCLGVSIGGQTDYSLGAGEGVLIPGGTEHALYVSETTAILGALVQVTGDQASTFLDLLAERCREGQARWNSVYAAEWARQAVELTAEGTGDEWELGAVSEVLRLSDLASDRNLSALPVMVGGQIAG